MQPNIAESIKIAIGKLETIALRPACYSIRWCAEADDYAAVRAITLELARVCDQLFEDLAEVADITDCVDIVTNAIDGNMEYQLREKEEECRESEGRSDYAEHNTLNHAQQGI